MANLVLTVDPDPHRRQQFLHAARQRSVGVSDLQVRHAEVGDLAVIWGSNSTAPQSCCQSPDGFALLLGYAIADNGDRLDAPRLLALWTNGAAPLPTFDGYYAAVAYQADRGLTLLGDPLGLFPLYRNEGDSVLVAGSSPEWCAAHPGFAVSLDLAGLVGILLSNGLVANRPLLAGLKRIEAGHRLEWNATRGAREVETFQLRADESCRHASFDELREHVDGEIRRAIHRHRPPQVKTSLLLSGGLDSRLLAGYLSEEGIAYAPVAWGRASDFEVQAAAEVAASLGLPLMREPREPEDAEFVEAARLTARWEHLAGGFGGIEAWSKREVVAAETAPFFWSGFVMDELLGGMAAGSGRDSKTKSWGFEVFLRKLNRWGLAPAALKRLLRLSTADRLLDELIAAWKCDYERAELSVGQQAIRAKLGSRARFHIGSIVHRLSFHSWPLLPILDRRLLQLLFNLDVEALLGRRLETELLVSRYPQLARIPFDTNSFRFSASRAKEGQNSASLMMRATDWLKYRGRRWYWQHWRRAEPRRYYRLYDLNMPCWQAVRDAAEPYRSSAYEWLDRTAFDDLLPPPNVAIESRDPFAAGAPRRTLLGLLLWAAPPGEGRRHAA
jgi:asparagine synthase (glutamine-hydrolysing)